MNPIIELCYIFLMSGKTQFCLEFLKNLEEITTRPEQKFVIGSCYQFIGEFEKSFGIYKTCINIGLDDNQIFKNISICCANMLQIDEAKSWLSKCDVGQVLKEDLDHISCREREVSFLGSDTGYWKDHSQHIHSPNLSFFIKSILPKNEPVHDFGCGTGFYLEVLREAGFENLQGYEGSPSSEVQFKSILKQDLTAKFSVPQKGNIICLEVAEHIPRKYEEVFLSNISDACNGYLVFSWAVRGQGGTCHVNCRNNDEVFEIMQKLGFQFHPELTQQGRNLIEDHCDWFRNTLLIFSKKDGDRDAKF